MDEILWYYWVPIGIFIVLLLLAELFKILNFDKIVKKIVQIAEEVLKF